MATLASRAKLLSGLSSGTLAEHLAAISLGTGAIFTSRISVSIESPLLTLVQRQRTDSRADSTPSVSVSSDDEKKSIFVTTQPASMNVRTVRNEWVVRSERSRSVAVRDLGEKQVSVRQRAVINVN